MQTDCVMQLANQHYFSPTLYRVKLCVRVTFSLNGYPSMLILSTCLCWPVCFTSRIKAMSNHLPYNCLCCLLNIIALSMYLVKWYTTILNNLQVQWYANVVNLNHTYNTSSNELLKSTIWTSKINRNVCNAFFIHCQSWVNSRHLHTIGLVIIEDSCIPLD
jgi:hypothetical protein